MTLTYHEIRSLDDPLYDAWLDLYQQSFPLNEQMLVSELNRTLREMPAGGSEGSHFLAAIDGHASVVGMARFDEQPEAGVTALWYLAVAADWQGRGIGTQLYAEVIRRARAVRPGWPVLFEVEVPGLAATEEQRTLCERRIAFYRRNGAVMLEGIDYVLWVGWQPRVPMLLMFHPPTSGLEAEAAFAAAVAALGESVRKTGDLALR